MKEFRFVRPVFRPGRLAALLVIAMSGQALEAAPPGEADHEELRAIMNLVADAFNEDRLADLQSVVTDSFVFTTSDQVALTSIEEIDKHYQKAFRADQSPLTGLVISPEASVPAQFVDDNNGFCYGTLREVYTLRSGGTVEVLAKWTASVTRVDGKWKVSSAHVGVHFMDNPVVERIKKTLVWWCLGGGLVLGAVLGGVFVLVLRHRKSGKAAGS